MKITILGAGGMGSRFAIMLQQAGQQVTLVDAWDQNRAAIKRYGIRARYLDHDITVHFPIYSPEESGQLNQPAQLVIIFIKSNQLQTQLEKIKALIGPDTYVLCLLNGLGHEDVLKQVVAPDHILLGITMWTAEMTGPGQVTLVGSGEVELQNLKPAGEAMAQRLVKVFNQAHLNPRYSHQVTYAIWRKACVNGTLNGLCALLECNIQALGQTTVAPELLTTIIGEFAAVAAHEGVNLDQQEIYQHVAATFTAAIGAHYPSMYQDLVANHRPTEIGFINGAVWKKGQHYGVPTPYCALITQLIQAKEQLLAVTD